MDRFTKTKKGFLDNNTGIIWKSSDEPKKLSHKEALKLNTAIWRLPTITELMGIIDYDRYEPATLLPVIRSEYYWSSSPCAGRSGLSWSAYLGYGNSNSSNPDYAWCVDFCYGFVTNSGREHKRRARLVRAKGERNEI